MLFNTIKSLLISKTFIHFCLAIIIIISLYKGINYSHYNQDYHHSFFILSMYIDLQNGFSYFKDIFLQYGPGQIVLLDLIDKIININVVSIYNINVVVYCLNLLILFSIFKKVSNIKISFIFIFIIFLIHPFSIYPWPDYLSGISLTLFIYFFLKKKNNSIYLSSFFLFLAVFFRSTYLINILLCIFLYSSVFFFLKKKNQFKKEIILFILFTIVYMLILFYNNNLGLWFKQSIGVIAEYAVNTKHLELYDKITKYIGSEGFIFLKIIYYFLRSLKNLLDLSVLNNFIFIFCIIINFMFLIKMIKLKLNIDLYDKKIFFISFLGLAGFIQSLMLMEVFRNINSTIGIFVTCLYFLNRNFKYKKNYSMIFFTIMSIYVILLINNFPKYTFKKSQYENYNNQYFSDSKKVKKEVKIYYQNLESVICNIKDVSIINTANDFIIPYLCKNQFIKSKSSYPKLFLKFFKKNEYERILINYNLKKNELLISPNEINSNKLLLIKKINNPHADSYYSNLYLYKMNNLN